MTTHVNIQFSAKEGRAKEAADNMANIALPMTRKQPGCLELDFLETSAKTNFASGVLGAAFVIEIVTWQLEKPHENQAITIQ